MESTDIKNSVVARLNKEFKPDTYMGMVQPRPDAREHAQAKSDQTGSPGTSNAAVEGSEQKQTGEGTNLFQRNWFRIGVAAFVIVALIYFIKKG